MKSPGAQDRTDHAASVAGLTEHLFREESAKLVSVLAGIFGPHRLQMAEDVVQEAMVRALQTWPYHGIPSNPSAWLMQTAKHRALDLLRREKFLQERQPEILATLEGWSAEERAVRFEDELGDDRLRLIFVCCHPQLPQESQIVLALKTLCGLGPAEIASAFFTTEAAIAKRLTRARQRISELGIAFEIPDGEALTPRLDGVLHTVYLLFSEGYNASSGESVVRAELCGEAIRLALALASHPIGDRPRTHALLALMLLDAARLEARQDAGGNLLRLADQDRSRWNKEWIARGLMHLSRAAAGTDLSEYHLQAGIAACHATAADYSSTDWRQILAHYDRWVEFSDSPVVALNRAVAVAHVRGAQAGIDALEAIAETKPLLGYYLFHAVRGDLEQRLGRYRSAAGRFRRSLELTEVMPERALLEDRLRDCLERSR